MSAVALASPSFTDRVHQLLERVDYRRADTPADREAIYRLRYEAYLREGTVQPNFSRKVTDPYDDTDNAWIFGVHVDGVLLSSFRLNVATSDQRRLPADQVFGDILTPYLDAGKVIVDPTRFVADPAFARQYPELPYVTVRLGYLAAEYFSADIVLATVRIEHQAFYRRVFGHRPVCEPRPYPSLIKPISLMMLDYPAAREQILSRYPFFRSTLFERRMLFERPAAEQTQRSAA